MTASAPDYPKVTVVVVARNEERQIAACVGSIAAQDYPNFTVILVDDGSTDATVSLARQALPSIRVISSPTRSISQNRDVGWRTADSEFVAYLDADCHAPANWLTSLVDAALSTGADAVGGGNRPPDGESAHYDALKLMLQTFVGSRGSIQGKLPDRGKFVKHLPGLNVLFRTEALRLVGGYDRRFARMGEDEDLSHRLTGIGAKLYATPEATVIHRQRADLRSWTRNMRAYGRGRTWLLRRHPNAVSPSFLLPPLTILALPVYLPLMALYSAALAARGRRPELLPRLFLLFAATHVAYGWGQIEGLFIRGDNDAAKAKRERIALLALKNAGNKGDEAITACVTARVVNYIDGSAAPIDLYLAAIGPTGFDIRPIPADARARDLMIADMLASASNSREVNDAAMFSLPRLLTVLLRFRAVVISGGQWLHDLSFTRHVAVSGMFAFARICGTNTGVFCIGAGPLRRGLSRWLVRLAFGRRSLIVTRDDASTRLLRSCGLAHAQTASDPAIELKSERVAGYAGKILISPCAWSTFENIYILNRCEIERSSRNWQELIRGLLDRGEKVAILPTMNPEDGSFAERIVRGFDGIEIISSDQLTPGELQGTIGDAKALVSMRLHPIIFGSNVGTSFVALTYAPKVRAYCEQAGFGARVVSLRDADWPEKVLQLLQQSPDLEVASKARARQQALLTAAYSQLLNWLSGVPENRALKHAVQLS